MLERRQGKGITVKTEEDAIKMIFKRVKKRELGRNAGALKQ